MAFADVSLLRYQSNLPTARVKFGSARRIASKLSSLQRRLAQAESEEIAEGKRLYQLAQHSEASDVTDTESLEWSQQRALKLERRVTRREAQIARRDATIVRLTNDVTRRDSALEDLSAELTHLRAERHAERHAEREHRIT